MAVSIALLLTLASIATPAVPISASPGGQLETLSGAEGAPRKEVLELALAARECAIARGETTSELLGLIDYSLPSTEPRFWLYDLKANRLLFRELVAHGKGSGDLRATVFSNLPSSHASSLGLFRTGTPYGGSHGLSLHLHGLERGFNDAAFARDIVIHGADYVSPVYARAHKRIGRSWGCPALRPAVARQIITALTRPTLLLSYFPDSRWLATSSYLRCPAKS